MKRNEKILAGVLGVAVAGYALRGPVMAVTVDPVRELEETRDGKLADAETLSDRKFELTLARQRVDEARARSLPADISDAERLYPQWLSDLAALSGFGEVETLVVNARTRRGQAYRPVKVSLKGRVTTDELDGFLRRFAQTDLLHRLNSVVVGSRSATGETDLTVELEAEAVSLPTATDRNALFPLAELTEPLLADATTATVSVPDDPTLRFPAEALFVVRAGRELLTVTAVEPGDGGAATWTVERAADDTDAADHSAGAFLQLWPRKAGGERLAMSETGPFRKPRTYEPRLNVDGPTRLVRGDEFTLKATAVDFDERAGGAKLSVADPPAGFALDPETGEMTWDPPDDLPAGEYPVTLTATVPKPETTLTETVTLTLAEKNTPPTLEPVEPQIVQAGDVLLFDVAAGDAEAPDGVTLSLADPPPGATIDADFGVVRWAVPEDADLGEKTLTVRATDGGDPPLTADATVAVTVTEDLRPFVKYVGFNAIGEEPRALVYNQADDRSSLLAPGDGFDIAGVKGVVRSVERRTLTVERNDRLLSMDLGQSLAQARDVGPAAAGDAAPEPDAGPAPPAINPPATDEPAAEEPATAELEAEADSDEVVAEPAAG